SAPSATCRPRWVRCGRLSNRPGCRSRSATIWWTARRPRRLRLVSSPKIGVNGTDIALELNESSCGDEACTDGCGADIDCRVWTHDGEESTQAPVGLIIDAVLREIYEPHAGTEVQAYELPDNLRRFFANRAKASRAA